MVVLRDRLRFLINLNLLLFVSGTLSRFKHLGHWPPTALTPSPAPLFLKSKVVIIQPLLTGNPMTLIGSILLSAYGSMWPMSRLNG